MEVNGLEMIINTKDGLESGVEEQGHTLSVFSVTDFAHSQNKAGMLKINKDLSLLPCLINSSNMKNSYWLPDIPTKTALSFTAQEQEMRGMLFRV